MREAVGGSLLFYIVITFLIIYIVFIGFIMNYASAYRAANYAVSQIENCNGDVDNCTFTSRQNICNNMKAKYGYSGSVKYSCSENGKGAVGQIKLGVEFELPFIGSFKPFNIKVETRTIYNVSCGSSQDNFCG